MQPTPNTRDRHALRWVLGVGLVFVVVCTVVLQVAWQHADERWASLMMALEPGFDELVVSPDLSDDSGGWYPFGINPEGLRNRGDHMWSDRTWSDRGGNLFRAWRRYNWNGFGFLLVVRQDIKFFGSSIEAKMSGGVPRQIDAARAMLAAVDIDLIVEP